MCPVTVDRPCQRPLEPQTRSSRSSRENTRQEPRRGTRGGRIPCGSSPPRLATSPCGPLVDDQLTVVQRRRRGGAATPQDRPHPGLELREGVGLGEDVVGTEVQQTDPLPLDDRPEQTMTGTELRRRILVSTSEVPPPRSKSRMTRSAGEAKTVSSDSSALAASDDRVADRLQVVLQGPAAVAVVLGDQDGLVGRDLAHRGEHRGVGLVSAPRRLSPYGVPWFERHPWEKSCVTAPCRRHPGSGATPRVLVGALTSSERLRRADHVPCPSRPLPHPVQTGSSYARAAPRRAAHNGWAPSCVLSVGR